MKAGIIDCSFGLIAFNSENKVVGKRLFPKEPLTAAQILASTRTGKIVDEMLLLTKQLVEEGYDTFVFENAVLANAVKERLNVKVEVEESSSAGEMLRSNVAQFAVELGFVDDTAEFERWLREIAVETTKLKVRQAAENRDLLLAQAIQTLDDLDKTINLFMSRVREWYGIHFPEFDGLLDKHETYARLVSKLGNKANFKKEDLEKESVPKSKAGKIVKSAETSMGADFAETDLAQVQMLSKNVLQLYKLRQKLENYLDTTMDEVAPNVKAIAGSLLGARLIALAGSLLSFAKMPASTVQVLGAEKALFRALKTGSRPPKHGIIFQHTFLHEAKRWQRGKIARAIAGKLAIAARIDVFGGNYKGEELKADLKRKIDEIHEKYASPAKVPEKKTKRSRRRKKRRARKR